MGVSLKGRRKSRQGIQQHTAQNVLNSTGGSGSMQMSAGQQHGVGVGGGSVPDFLNAEISQDDFVSHNNSNTSGQKNNWGAVRKPSVGGGTTN